MTVLRWVLQVSAVIAGYWLLLYAAQRSVIFPGAAAPSDEAALARAGGERVWLQLGARKSEAWFLPSLAPAGPPSPLIIFAHGNAELIDYWPEAFDTPRRWGVSILLVEYPGYGRSEGRPSEKSITAAMVAAYDWAVARQDIDPARVIAYGRSVGGGAASDLARERPVGALVLESTFTSVRRMALRFAAPGFLVRDPFDNLSLVRRFTKPLLIIHGVTDDIIPVWHGRALARAAPSAELQLLPCGHNDCPRPWPVLRRFLEDHEILNSPGPTG